MLLLATGLLLAVAAVVVYAARVGSVGSGVSARHLLDARLVAGDITAEEHRARLAVLTEQPSPARRGAVPLTLGGLALVLLVAAAVGIGRSTDDGWWRDHDRMMPGHMGWTTDQADTP